MNSFLQELGRADDSPVNVIARQVKEYLSTTDYKTYALTVYPLDNVAHVYTVCIKRFLIRWPSLTHKASVCLFSYLAKMFYPRCPRITNVSTLVCVVGVILAGCFHPAGEYFVEKESPDFEGIGINLTNNTSEVYIYKPTRISYDIEDSNYQLIAIEGFLDGKSLRNPKDPTVITIDPARYSHGTHELKIAATFISYSGTLASTLGRETKTITREFPVMIDLQSPPPVSITTMQARDGSLFIHWNKPSKENFLNYQVHRFTKQNNQWVESLSSLPWVLGKHRTEFNDSLYAGGDVRYRVDIVGYTYSTFGNLADTTFKTILPVMTQTGTNTVTVSWPRSLFYNNISAIYVSSYNESNVQLPAKEQASFTREFPFGTAVTNVVIPQLKYGNADLSTVINAYVGNIISVPGVTDQRQPFTYSRAGTTEFMTASLDGYPSRLQRVNSSQNTLIETIELEPYYQSSRNPYAKQRAIFASTPNGNNIYFTTGTEIIRFDASLNFISKHELTNLFQSPFFNLAYKFRFSNNNIGAFLLYTDLRLMDFEKNQVIATGLSNNSVYDVSPDGKYFCYNQRLYDISSGTMVEVADFTDSRFLRNVQFNANSSQLFMTYTSGHFKIIDVASKAIISSHEFGGDIRYQILDPVTGQCGITVYNETTSKSEFLIFDPATFIVSKKIFVSNTNYFLYNNILYSETGYALQL